MKNYVITLVISLIIGLAFADAVFAHDYHHHDPVTNTYQISNSKGVALAAASGQHHYKATNLLQWSIGGAHIDNSSAVSFGLGKQAGKVFISGNISSDGSATSLSFGASGTF